ncbi:hypothetical protein DUNSADRAFT_15370 [Dunaliella salina]|uniref:Uncharacterized protein n=1 Tax=Dunaliella salina TaxID=3046 RepID=A0ABQ7H1V8_DUNSA|nr:hypothetical protein DUNSADRAFT_15370 [Dunaliella salina]|eukprot:KAF5840828.1 hypothetical protein DUNSADRAFT_15370 [Dunaliella salina]
MKRKGEETRAFLTYQQHIFEQNEAVLVLWPILFIFHVMTAFMSLYNRTYSKGHAVVTLACCLACWFIRKAALWRSSKLLRGLFVLFGFLQMIFYLNYLRGKDSVANVHLYLDLGTNLYSVTPQLVMGLTGAPLLAYVLFIGSHIAAATLFYLYIAKMTMPWALLRAVGIHALTFSAASAVHKRARASYQRRLARHQALLQGEDEATTKPTKAWRTSRGVARPLTQAWSAPDAAGQFATAHAAGPQSAGYAAGPATTHAAAAAAAAAAAPQHTGLSASLLKPARPIAGGLASGGAEGGEVSEKGLLWGKHGHTHAACETAPWSSFAAVQQQQQQQQQQQGQEPQEAQKQQQQQQQQQQLKLEAGAALEQKQQHRQLRHSRTGVEETHLAVPSLSGPANLRDCSAHRTAQADVSQNLASQPVKHQHKEGPPSNTGPISARHTYRSALKRRTVCGFVAYACLPAWL